MTRKFQHWIFIASGILVVAGLSALPVRSEAQETQRKLGSRWIPNYLSVPYAAALATLYEMIASPAPPAPPGGPPASPAPGFLQRNAGYLSPETIEYYKEWLPFRMFGIPHDILKKYSPPTPPPPLSPTLPKSSYLSDAKTRNGINSWSDFLEDVHRSTQAQMFEVDQTAYQRSGEHLAAISSELRDGQGRFAVVGPSASRGIGGQDLGRAKTPAGDVAAAAAAAEHALYDLAQRQDPGERPVTDPSDAYHPQFVPSPRPTRSVLPGGSNAGPDLANVTGILPGGDPFDPFRNVPPGLFLDPIVDRINNIISNFGSIPGALSNFGGPLPVGDVADIFGNSRTGNLLGQGGGGSPAPATTSAPEDAQCPEASAQRARDTVINAARLLQLPSEPSWLIALRTAESLFNVRGTNVETKEEVTINQASFATGSCVWVVSSGSTDAVFLSDEVPTVFRLINISS